MGNRSGKFIKSEFGATLVEYGVALVVTIIVGASAITILGNRVSSELSETASAF